MRLISSLAVILGFWVCSVARSQTSVVVEFPFQFREGLLWISVTVSQSPKPLNFLVDTGAGVCVLNYSTAQQLGIQLGQEVKVTGVESTTVGYWPQKLTASIGQVSLPKEFLVVDLCKLSQACNRSVDGLLGADFFSGKIVQLDFEQQKLRILQSSEPHAGAEVLPLLERGNALQVPVQVNARAAEWFRLDTGCASSLQWVTTREQLSASSRHIAVGLSQQSIPMTATTVKLGRHQFYSVPTGLHQTQIFRGESGLLGLGMLTQFAQITLDGKTHRLILENGR